MKKYVWEKQLSFCEKEFQNTPSFKIERFIENICSKATNLRQTKESSFKRK